MIMIPKQNKKYEATKRAMLIDCIRNKIRIDGRYTVYGISRDNIILDPGIGFGKGIEENIEVMARLEELRDMGRILLGTSKKGFIGTILGGVPTDERVEGTAATTVIGIEKGVDIVRVHNVLENKRVALVADRIYRR